MKLAFLGDISLNDDYTDMYKLNLLPFNEVGAFLEHYDHIIGNLESLSEGIEGENLRKNPRIRTNITSLNYLKDFNVNVVGLANNHVYDNLKDGFCKTLAFLENQGISYLGASTDLQKSKQPLVLNKDGVSVCLLNYLSIDTNPCIPTEADVYPNWMEEERMVDEIKCYKKLYSYVILLMHWGGRVEGGKYPDWDQRGLAHRLIDSGADLIIGNHPHTIQPYEIYNGKYIYYSLGNFCFSKVLAEGRVTNEMNLKRYRESRIVLADFSNDSVHISTRITYRDQIGFIKIIKRSVLPQQLMFKIIFSSHWMWETYFYLYKYFKPINEFIHADSINFKDKVSRVRIKILKRF